MVSGLKQPHLSLKNKGLLTKIKYIAEKTALAILLRFKAMADGRRSSVAAKMPRFLIFKRLCSLFMAAKLPSAQIFRFLIMHRYSRSIDP